MMHMDRCYVRMDAEGGVVAAMDWRDADGVAELEGWLPVQGLPEGLLCDPWRMVPRWVVADGVLGLRDEAALCEAAARLPQPVPDTAQRLARLLLEAGVLDGARAAALPEAFRAWRAGTGLSPQAYAAGEAVAHGGGLYRCCQAHAHRGEAGWAPGEASALWAALGAAAPDPWAIADWRQPEGSHDAYAAGACVWHGGALYESRIAANTAEPGTDGRWWKAVEA